VRALVVYCHPVPESFTAAVRDAALAGLAAGGHEVRLLDLYAEGFDPVMGAGERRGYHTPGDNERPVAERLEEILWAEALVFVYPTWWYGLPAMLKGWLDRVWVPYVTFTLPETGAIEGCMKNIRRLVVITSCGSPWIWITLMGDPGRRTILRGIRAICHPRCRRLWLTHYRIDHSTAATRKAFLERVERRLRRI